MTQADITAIQLLKYRYFRCLDQKKFDDLGELLLSDCTAAYHNGRFSYPDKASMLEFLRGSLSPDHILIMHQGHHPEIELLSDEHARGTWYLHDIVINLKERFRLEGNGFYSDEYRKVDGQWKISRTGYRRTFEIVQPLGEVLSLYNGFRDEP